MKEKALRLLGDRWPLPWRPAPAHSRLPAGLQGPALRQTLVPRGWRRWEGVGRLSFRELEHSIQSDRGAIGG